MIARPNDFVQSFLSKYVSTCSSIP